MTPYPISALMIRIYNTKHTSITKHISNNPSKTEIQTYFHYISIFHNSYSIYFIYFVYFRFSVYFVHYIILNLECLSVAYWRVLWKTSRTKRAMQRRGYQWEHRPVAESLSTGVVPFRKPQRHDRSCAGVCPPRRSNQ